MLHHHRMVPMHQVMQHHLLIHVAASSTVHWLISLNNPL